MVTSRQQVTEMTTSDLEVVEQMMSEQLFSASEPNPLWKLGLEWVREELLARDV